MRSCAPWAAEILKMLMKRIRLTAAYDGAEFAGFQSQPGLRTVEGELDRALTELTGAPVSIIGASRTDSGVHALGNVAVFDTDSPIPPDRYPQAAIPFLPDDLRIVCSDEVDPDWHPRHQACLKTYEYTFACGRIEDPMFRRYRSFVKRPLDVEAMREAAEYLVGEHDFTSFANPSSQVLQQGGSPVRTIRAVSIAATEPEAWRDLNWSTVRIRITGSGFLYNMVRIIAGTLQNVGAGLWTPERVGEALEARDRTKAGPTAEARGLTLCGIEYF